MKKILIIDDEQSYLVKIKHIIQKTISDCTVLTAKTGEEGISIAISEQPDTILLDVVMPVLDGYSVCKKLKSNASTQRIPIILVSAFQKDTDSRVLGLESGADVFLSKPFDTTELSAQVVAMLRIRSAEKAIVESNVKFRTVADFAHDWEFWIGNDGKMIYTSPSCERITGYAPNDFLENQELFYSIVHYLDVEKVKAHHQDMENGCACEHLEYRIIDKSGKIKWIGHVCKTVFNPNNENIGIRGSNREITKRKLAEEKVYLQTKELKIRNEELDAFAHTVAHDLRTPIGTIIGFADILNDGFDDITVGERREFLSHIEDTGHKSLQILNNLLLFAKVRKSDSPLEVLDMEKIVVETNNRLSSIIKKNNVEVILPTNWSKAVGYAPWIEEVWVNFINNAIKYGGSEPKVIIGHEVIEADGVNKEMVKYWVRDNGAGISEKDQKLLFRQFERLNQANIKGHGLGLSIVRRIIEKLGGEVGVESIVGGGSVFYFTLAKA